MNIATSLGFADRFHKQILAEGSWRKTLWYAGFHRQSLLPPAEVGWGRAAPSNLFFLVEHVLIPVPGALAPRQNAQRC